MIKTSNDIVNHSTRKEVILMGNHYIDDTLILMPNSQVQRMSKHVEVAKAALSSTPTDHILLKMVGIVVLASLLYIPIIQHDSLSVRYSEIALLQLHT
jgi:hypothetical protein